MNPILPWSIQSCSEKVMTKNWWWKGKTDKTYLSGVVRLEYTTSTSHCSILEEGSEGGRRPSWKGNNTVIWSCNRWGSEGWGAPLSKSPKDGKAGISFRPMWYNVWFWLEADVNQPDIGRERSQKHASDEKACKKVKQWDRPSTPWCALHIRPSWDSTRLRGRSK